MEGAVGSGGPGQASRSTTPSDSKACGDLAGGRARRRPQQQRHHEQHTRVGHRPPAHTAARPGFETTRRAKLAARTASRPPAHTAARPDGARNTRHQRGNKHHKQPRNANARQPARAAARSRNYFALDTVERPATQRSRAATTSATWTAFRAAPLRRLSPETTRMRPRLPSTA